MAKTILDDWAIRQVLRLRWLQLMQLNKMAPSRMHEFDYERLKISRELIGRVGAERTADLFDRLLNGIGHTRPGISIGVKL